MLVRVQLCQCKVCTAACRLSLCMTKQVFPSPLMQTPHLHAPQTFHPSQMAHPSLTARRKQHGRPSIHLPLRLPFHLGFTRSPQLHTRVCANQFCVLCLLKITGGKVFYILNSSGSEEYSSERLGTVERIGIVFKGKIFLPSLK